MISKESIDDTSKEYMKCLKESAEKVFYKNEGILINFFHKNKERKLQYKDNYVIVKMSLIKPALLHLVSPPLVPFPGMLTFRLAVVAGAIICEYPYQKYQKYIKTTKCLKNKIKDETMYIFAHNKILCYYCRIFK